MFYSQIFMSFLLMQAVFFSMSQLQYFQLSTLVELYKKNQKNAKILSISTDFSLGPISNIMARNHGHTLLRLREKLSSKWLPKSYV